MDDCVRWEGATPACRRPPSASSWFTLSIAAGMEWDDRIVELVHDCSGEGARPPGHGVRHVSEPDRDAACHYGANCQRTLSRFHRRLWTRQLRKRRAADHLHRRRQESRAFEMNEAGTIGLKYCHSLYVLTPVPLRADSDCSPRSDSLEFEVYFTSHDRAPLPSKPTRSVAAYGPRHITFRHRVQHATTETGEHRFPSLVVRSRTPLESSITCSQRRNTRYKC